MDDGDSLLKCANRLEWVLRRYLNCHYSDFGVKANDNLLNFDWKSPINFALGHKYGQSNNNPEMKEKIDYFLGNQIRGQNLEDLINKFEYWGFETQEEVYTYVEKTINELEEILKS